MWLGTNYLIVIFYKILEFFKGCEFIARKLEVARVHIDISFIDAYIHNFIVFKYSKYI